AQADSLEALRERDERIAPASCHGVGALNAGKGPRMKTWAGCSDVLPVTGSAALMSNWFGPRRKSTSAAHVASAAAKTRYGCSRPGVLIEIAAPGTDVPRRTYDVAVPSSARMPAAGAVTTRAGGRA